MRSPAGWVRGRARGSVRGRGGRRERRRGEEGARGFERGRAGRHDVVDEEEARAGRGREEAKTPSTFDRRSGPGGSTEAACPGPARGEYGGAARWRATSSARRAPGVIAPVSVPSGRGRDGNDRAGTPSRPRPRRVAEEGAGGEARMSCPRNLRARTSRRATPSYCTTAAARDTGSAAAARATERRGGREGARRHASSPSMKGSACQHARQNPPPPTPRRTAPQEAQRDGNRK